MLRWTAIMAWIHCPTEYSQQAATGVGCSYRTNSYKTIWIPQKVLISSSKSWLKAISTNHSYLSVVSDDPLFQRNYSSKTCRIMSFQSRPILIIIDFLNEHESAKIFLVPVFTPINLPYRNFTWTETQKHQENGNGTINLGKENVSEDNTKCYL